MSSTLQGNIYSWTGWFSFFTSQKKVHLSGGAFRGLLFFLSRSVWRFHFTKAEFKTESGKEKRALYPLSHHSIFFIVHCLFSPDFRRDWTLDAPILDRVHIFESTFMCLDLFRYDLYECMILWFGILVSDTDRHIAGNTTFPCCWFGFLLFMVLHEHICRDLVG